MKHSRTALGALVAAIAMTVAACGGGDPTTTDTGGEAPSDTIVVGSANFQENVLLAYIYAEALKAKGVKVDTKLNIGSREAYFAGLEDGSIDLIPEYNGNLLRYVNPDATETTQQAVDAALPDALPEGLSVLTSSPAEDKDAIVVTQDTADQYNLASIADLAPVAGDLTLGGPPEFKTRPDGIPGLEKVYGVTFGSYKTLDAGGPLTENALKNGQIDAGDIFTTDPNITEQHWVVLADPKSNFAAQNVVPLINSDKATSTVTDALNAVSAKLTTEDLIAMLTKVYAKEDPDTVAKDWLTQAGLI